MCCAIECCQRVDWKEIAPHAIREGFHTRDKKAIEGLSGRLPQRNTPAGTRPDRGKTAATAAGLDEPIKQRSRAGYSRGNAYILSMAPHGAEPQPEAAKRSRTAICKRKFSYCASAVCCCRQARLLRTRDGGHDRGMGRDLESARYSAPPSWVAWLADYWPRRITPRPLCTSLQRSPITRRHLCIIRLHPRIIIPGLDIITRRDTGGRESARWDGLRSRSPGALWEASAVDVSWPLGVGHDSVDRYSVHSILNKACCIRCAPCMDSGNARNLIKT
jgi:hypothetical protein